MRSAFCSLLLLGLLAVLPTPTRAADFPLKDGDTWVMVGDSITAQHMHSNYFEAFCFARYPKLTFRFRNSGVGGATIPSSLARYDYDASPWKPTVVSVELGMNDQGGIPVPQFIANMEKMTERIRKDNARPIYLSPSPINNGNLLAQLSPKEQDNASGNARLHRYSIALKDYAAQQKAPYADQFHALVDIWGKNKPNESLLTAINSVRPLAARKDLDGVEHLQAFLKANEEKSKNLVSMMGDPVHPGEPGQLMMAAALLKDLGADGLVSSVTIDAGTGKVSDATKCVIEEMGRESGKLTFTRLDESIPFPIPDNARNVLPLYPTILELSRYELKVTGLKEGKYKVQVNGTLVTTLSAEELAKGVNLTAYGQGAIAAQGKEVLAAVSAKESLVSQWRGMSKAAIAADASPDTKAQFAEQTKKVEEADAKIREAARPRKLKFEITAG